MRVVLRYIIIRFVDLLTIRLVDHGQELSMLHMGVVVSCSLCLNLRHFVSFILAVSTQELDAHTWYQNLYAIRL